MPKSELVVGGSKKSWSEDFASLKRLNNLQYEKKMIKLREPNMVDRQKNFKYLVFRKKITQKTKINSRKKNTYSIGYSEHTGK